MLRPLSAELLRNTVELAVLVTAATVVIGTAAAWCVERTALPLRRMWAFLLVLPLAIPDFVVGYAWHSIRPGFVGLRAAWVVMTLDLYPFVFLPVAAALRRTDPALEEASRALGVGPWRTFIRVVVPQIRAAILGGSLLVMLALLAEFGAFEILDFRTFTTEIFTELQVDRAAAAGLSLILVALGILVLVIEALASGERSGQSGQPASRPPPDADVVGQMADPGPIGVDGTGWAGPRAPRRHHHLLVDGVRPHHPAAEHNPPVRHVHQSPLFGGGGRGGYGRGHAGGPARGPAFRASGHRPGAQHVPRAVRPRGRRRPEPGLLRGEVCLLALPDEHSARAGVCLAVLSDGPGMRSSFRGASLAPADRDGALPRGRALVEPSSG